MGHLKRNYVGILLVIGVVGYYLMAYHLGRTNHLALFSTYIILFVLGILLTLNFKKYWKAIFISGFVFRLLFIGATPQLSDDFFRFTWDGELQKIGESAFSFKPQDYEIHFQGDSLNTQKFGELYAAQTEAFPEGMNSKGYHSIYPPLSQLIFTISSFLGSPNHGNLIVMRLFILLMEVVSFFMLRKLLMAKGRATWLTGLYWFNPLVIIELTGNLHFEGMAIGFLLLALYFFSQQQTSKSGLALAMAISAKINPVFMLGAAFKHTPQRRFIALIITTLLITLIGFVIVLDTQTLWNFKNSFGLYFTWFEFNTGIFYLFREAGYILFDIDITSKISLIFPSITVLLFIWVCFSKAKYDIYQRLLMLYVIYFLFSPVVHPWYIVMLIPLGILTHKLYPILWSLLIFFTYSAYGEVYGESYWVIGLEYSLVLLLMYLEYKGSSETLNRLKRYLYQGVIKP